jgi:hypothetical protein
MFSLHYAFVLSTLFELGPLFILLWWLRPDVRRKVGRLSLVGSVIGPISEYWYVQDYWHPVHMSSLSGPLEDMLFAGLIIGITVASYSVIGRVVSVDAGYGNKRRRYYTAIAVCLGCLVIFTNLFHLNSIYSSTIAFVFLAGLMWYQRPDLLAPSLLGGVFMCVCALYFYTVILYVWPTLIQDWWQWQNISGITFLHIPLEEFMWFTTWGFVVSVIYEWKHGQKFVPLTS